VEIRAVSHGAHGHGHGIETVNGMAANVGAAGRGAGGPAGASERERRFRRTLCGGPARVDLADEAVEQVAQACAECRVGKRAADVEGAVGGADRQLGLKDARRADRERLAHLGLCPDGAEEAGARTDDRARLVAQHVESASHPDPRQRGDVIFATVPIHSRAVSDTVDALILDLLEWMGPNPRPYAEVLEAWRTSCPRLPVWEDANDLGFIERHRAPGRSALVAVSASGREHLRKHRHSSPR
jgi:hypothetical protein